MKKSTLALTIITVIVVIVTSILGSCTVDKNEIFEEEVSFGGFYTAYNEPWIGCN